MSKKDKNKKKDIIDYSNEKIIQNNIGELCTDLMKIFGANTNLMRHVPSLVDGLKPGERRILFTMYKAKMFHTGKDVKVATIVGDTMKLHPHGDGPIYETLVKMAQPWNNILCPIDGHGNFGNLMGAPAAAGRYIEAKLSYFSYKCYFEEFDEKVVDMKWNYSNDILEPEFLPAKYPVALINNAFGIGYGISCGIPTYNFNEVIELTKKLIEDPFYEDITLYPDATTSAMIIDDGCFKTISETGKGKFRMRGEMVIDEERNSITIKSIPFKTLLSDIKKDILDLFKEKKLQGLKAINDKSGNRSGGIGRIELEFVLKKEVDPVAIMHAIYKKTSMEKTFPINFKLIDEYEENDYNIRTVLLEWIQFRRDIKRKIYNQKLSKAKERQHILETLLFILNKDNAENTIRIIKDSENKKQIVERLMTEYNISSLQADAISEMRLSAFSKDARKKYKDEKEEVDKKVEKYEKIVKSTKKIDSIIVEELEEGMKLFGEPRRSKIINVDGEVKINDSNHLIVFTMNGFVKKLSDQCKSVGFINSDDYPIEIIEARNTSELLLFDETGKISKIAVHRLQNCELTSEGEKLNKFCNVNGSIVSIIPKPTEEILNNLKVPIYFLMITAEGIIKKTIANDYTNIKNELLGIIIKDGDKLKSVKLLAGDKDLVLYTNKGFGARLSSSEIKITSRLTKGLKEIDISDSEEVIGMDILNEKDKYLFILTNKGTGKKCDLKAFPVLDRKSKPLRLVTLDDDESVMMVKTVKGNEKFKAYLKNSIEEISLENVLELPRLSKGKKLIPVRKGEVIIDIKEIK